MMVGEETVGERFSGLAVTRSQSAHTGISRHSIKGVHGALHH